MTLVSVCRIIKDRKKITAFLISSFSDRDQEIENPDRVPAIADRGQKSADRGHVTAKVKDREVDLETDDDELSKEEIFINTSLYFKLWRGACGIELG